MCGLRLAHATCASKLYSYCERHLQLPDFSIRQCHQSVLCQDQPGQVGGLCFAGTAAVAEHPFEVLCSLPAVIHTAVSALTPKPVLCCMLVIFAIAVSADFNYTGAVSEKGSSKGQT